MVAIVDHDDAAMHSGTERCRRVSSDRYYCFSNIVNLTLIALVSSPMPKAIIRDVRDVPAEATERESVAFMRLLHLIEATHSGRATVDLDLRQRLIVQAIGLSGPAAIAGIGQRLGVSPSTMTGLVDRLERQGYVERRRHPTDRRATFLMLTRKGQRAFEREKDFYRRLINEMLAPIGEAARRLVLQALDQLSAGRTDAT